MTDNSSSVAAGREPQFLGHPKGLFYLFFAELWERFSFYGMRALLTLYMANKLFKEVQNGEEISISIYAAYGALVYATPFLGGLLADRILGYRKAILLGGLLMTAGHFALAFEADIFFYGGLALIIAGNGFFKPNISTFVGTLYEQGDARRDAGFNIFYMGINIGAWAAPLACGWLAVEYGWHYGFGAAGIGMLAGLIFFWSGLKSNVFGATNGTAPAGATASQQNMVYLLTLLMVPVFGVLLIKNEFVGNILYIALIPILIILIKEMVSVSKEAWQRLVVALVLTFFMTIFWSFFELGGSALTLFAEKSVNLGLGLNAAQTNAINPFFIILFAVVFSILWTYLSRTGRNPRTPIKFAMGIAQLGLGFLLFVLGARFMDDAAKVPFIFLVLGYLFISTGELFLSPVGLSKLTELSTKKVAGFMMGIWFISSAFAHHFAGIIAKLTAGSGSDNASGSEGGIMGTLVSWVSGMNAATVQTAGEEVQKLYLYATVFTQVAVIAFSFALLALVLTPWMKKWMHGIH